MVNLSLSQWLPIGLINIWVKSTIWFGDCRITKFPSCTISILPYFLYFIIQSVYFTMITIYIYTRYFMTPWLMYADLDFGCPWATDASVIRLNHIYGNPTLGLYACPLVGFPPLVIKVTYNDFKGSLCTHTYMLK